jgi:hypothetical protein
VALLTCTPHRKNSCRLIEPTLWLQGLKPAIFVAFYGGVENPALRPFHPPAPEDLEKREINRTT